MTNENFDTDICSDLHRFKRKIFELRENDSKIKMKLNECIPTKSFSNIVDVKKNCKGLYQNMVEIYNSRDKLIANCLAFTQKKYEEELKKNINGSQTVNSTISTISKNLLYFKREAGVEKIIHQQGFQVFLNYSNLLNLVI